ncbi:MAG: hypothetical protein ABW185_23290 [Sedimenticola sp.]
MLAWVEDAPNFETNSEDEIQAFVDKHITCSIPGDDEDLSNLLGHVQKHTHSVACRKHGKKCRFHFPRPLVRRTIAASPPAEPVPSHQQEIYTDTLQDVQEQLEKLDINTNMSFDTLLAEANVSEETYIQALLWIKTESGQPAILLKRKPCEVSINSYNSVLIKAWEANIDAQFVTNVYQCVMYVASYISKSEKTLGDVLKAVSESGQHLGPKESMKHVAKKFLTHREISAQEAVYRLLSLPLTRGSHQVIFIPTDLPANRTRLFKPMKVIEALEDDDPDVFQTNILDRYQARPSVLAQLCLADFASTYSVSSSPPKADIHPDLTDEEDNAENTPLPKSIKLNNDLGHMVLRKTPAILRSHQFSETKDPEQYYHAQLLLYHPWREETADLCQSNYRTFYLNNLPKVAENRARHEYHSEEVSAAVDDLAEYGAPEDAWADLAPQAEQARHDDTHEGTHPDASSVLNAFDTNQDRQAARDLGLIPHEYVHITER